MNKLHLTAGLVLGITISLAGVASAAFAPISIPAGGTGTTTAPVSQLLYGSATGYRSVATTSASCSGSASCTSFTVIGSSPITISATGGSSVGTVSTSTTPTRGGLSYWSSSGSWPETLASVATTSVTCSGNTSCTSFTAIGGAPITISSTGGGTGLSTTSPISGSNVLVYSSTGAGAAYGAATTSLTATGVLSLSQPISVIGSVASALTVTGGTGGQILGWSGGVPTWLATTTFTGTSPISLSYSGGLVTGSCTTAASGVAGCLSNTAFDTFNNKQATISATWPITLSGATVGFNGLSTSTAAVQGNVPYFSGANTFANVATSTQTLSASFSTTGAMGNFLGGTSGTLSGVTYFTFTVSTTTTWTGTTTIPLGPAYVAETWDGIMCATDVGTLNVDVYYSSTHMALLNASTTVGTFKWTSSNTPAATNVRKVDIGTPASSPKTLTCTVKKTI